MTRIVGGVAGGRRLAVPPGRATRPTADRTREALFSALAALTGSLEGLRFLDLYAGSGAVGIEALSRGAAAATLVESDPAAVRTARANLAALDLPGGQVQAVRVERFVAARAPPPGHDVAFADPPYDMPAPALGGVVAALAAGGWLVPGGIVVVERSSRDIPWSWPGGIAPVRSRRYGEGTLWYGRAARGDREG